MNIRQWYRGGQGLSNNTAGDEFFLSTTPADLPWFGLAYGNGLWVSIADGGVNPVMTSPDGITWTQQIATNVRWRNVTYDPINGKFCACSISGTFRIMNSTDGITWVNRTAAFATSWFGIAYGNGYLVSCGNGRIQWSTNGGDSWTAVVVPAGDYRQVAYSPDLNLWAAVGNGVIITATDPTGTWTARTGGASRILVDIVYDNGLFVASDFTANTNAVVYSSDGITWNTATGSLSYNRNGITYGNNRWVTVGSLSRMEYSLDAITWTDETARLPVFTGQIEKIRYADDKFIAVISSGSTGQRVLIST